MKVNHLVPSEKRDSDIASLGSFHLSWSGVDGVDVDGEHGPWGEWVQEVE